MRTLTGEFPTLGQYIVDHTNGKVGAVVRVEGEDVYLVDGYKANIWDIGGIHKRYKEYYRRKYEG